MPRTTPDMGLQQALCNGTGMHCHQHLLQTLQAVAGTHTYAHALHRAGHYNMALTAFNHVWQHRLGEGHRAEEVHQHNVFIDTQL